MSRLSVRARATGFVGPPPEPAAGWTGVVPGEWNLYHNKEIGRIELSIPLVLPEVVEPFSYHQLQLSYAEADRLAKLIDAMLIGFRGRS